ncbi:MAG: alpha/beta hydrolase [Pseudomonadota bacterium]
MRIQSVITCIFFSGLLMCGCTPTAQDTTLEANDTPFESPYFSVSVSGSGPDIILMPGLASSGAVWDQTVSALQSQNTLHVIQVHGFAGAPAAGNSGNDDILDDLATDLSSYAKQLPSSPVVIGHSLGGLVAMKTALIPDTPLEELVIVDVLPFFSVLMDPSATSESIAPVSAVMTAALLAQSEDVFSERQAEALAALVKNQDDLDLTLSWSVASDRAVMAQAMSEVLVTDLRSDVSRIATPTTIIYARDDAIANMAVIEDYYHDLYQPISDHSLIAIDDAFHFVMLDQPDSFQAAINSALVD